MLDTFTNRFLGDKRGQVNQVIGAIVGVGVGFMVLSLASNLILTFEGNLAANPANDVPFNELLPLVGGGVLLIALIMLFVKVLR